ncbi:hypothetical protein J4E93_003063 [Alternaria ventricosa]|uniref:uncharacterized protein n=1 Tax=Alternaria ventricosa TaxID=1187951 RepID=UPI0020C1C6F2|nr:uncharacterized protein J4E93_003063 [Alternaria ventricosa]KAI4650706.1 hypothetical protein J4E93_003063 [Alternaria ventricosa]
MQMRIDFRAVESLLYDVPTDLDSAFEGDTDDENSEDGDHDDESTDDDESEVDQEEDTLAVAQSETSTDTHADISTRIDEARDDTVAEKTPDTPSPKTKTKPSARTTRFSRRLKDLDALRAQEEENMHYSPRRRKGKEFKGGPIDPEKAHLGIGERELADHDGNVVLAELESNVRGAA